MNQLKNSVSRVELSELTKHEVFGDVVAQVKAASEKYETSQNTVGDFLAPLVYLASDLVLDIKSRTKKAEPNVTTASDWIKWLNPNVTQSEAFAKQLSRLTLSKRIRELFKDCKTLDDYTDTMHIKKLYTFKAWKSAASGTDTGTKNLTLTQMYDLTPSALRRHFKKTYNKAEDAKLAKDLKVRKIQVEVLNSITDKRKANRVSAKKRGSKAATIHSGSNGRINTAVNDLHATV